MTQNDTKSRSIKSMCGDLADIGLYFTYTGDVFNQSLCQIGLATMTKQYNTPSRRSWMALGVNARRRRPCDMIASYVKRGQFSGL